MRALLVTALLLAGLLAVPSGSAAPNCALEPEPEDCAIDYAQGQANGKIDYVQQRYDALQEDTCVYVGTSWFCPLR